MNLVIMIGRMTKDPEVRYTQGDNSTAILSGNIAVDRRYKRDNEPDADFFQVTAFGKTAESMEKYIHKGSKIAITGRMQNDNYTDKNGNKVYGNKIIIETWEFAQSKKDDESQSDISDGFTNTPSGDMDELPFN